MGFLARRCMRPRGRPRRYYASTLRSPNPIPRCGSDPAQVQRTVVALRVMAPNALGPIEDMIPIMYPGVRLSYGKVQSMAAEAEAQAAAFKADLSGVRAGALDELFSQGEPVLAGVDLDHGYLFGLALRETRRGED